MNWSLGWKLLNFAMTMWSVPVGMASKWSSTYLYINGSLNGNFGKSLSSRYVRHRSARTGAMGEPMQQP